jgi:hypothetical protein
MITTMGIPDFAMLQELLWVRIVELYRGRARGAFSILDSPVHLIFKKGTCNGKTLEYWEMLDYYNPFDCHLRGSANANGGSA